MKNSLICCAKGNIKKNIKILNLYRLKHDICFLKKKKILIYVVALGGIEPVKEVGR
jgi:hypothetical protein